MPDNGSLLDDAHRALDDGRIADATGLIDEAALRPLDAIERVRLLLAEGRLAVDAGQARAASTALDRTVDAAESLGGPEAARLAGSARLELLQLALRSGRASRAAALAGQLDGIDPGRRQLVDAAVLVLRGEPAAADGIDELADALLRDEGPGVAALLANTVGLALIWAERYDAADRLLARLVRIARPAGPLGSLPHLLGAQALCDLRAGRYRAAAAHGDEAVRLADSTLRPGLTTTPLAVLAVAEAIRGDAAPCKEAAGRLTERSVRADGTTDGLAAEISARAAIGLLHLGLDEPELAVVELAPLAERTRTAPWLVMWQMDLAESLVRCGRPADALAVVDEFEAGLGSVRSGRAPAAAARVRALACADDPAAAEALLDRSEALLREVGNPFGTGRTLLVRGVLRRRWGRDADGLADLARAEAMFRAVGAEGWAAQAAHRASGGAAATMPRPDPLTPQELQVAGLVVTGRSNREVADALFVSARTVESHLGRIYRKLGVRSRAQLIARADEWGLREPRDW